MCLGDVMTDVVATLTQPLAHGSDSPAPVRLLAGGSAANTAAWLAATGHHVTLVGRIGADSAGETARTTLERAGVHTRLAIDPDRPTGTCIVLVSPDGERSMIPDAGANAALSPSDLPSPMLDATSHLHVVGYALLNQGSREAARRAIDLARSAGSSVSIDPSSVGPLTTLGADRFLSWVHGSDLLLANADEARTLTGVTDVAAAASALTEAFNEVVVTLGADGALWVGRDQDQPVHVAAQRVDVVDSTGAGDAFAAGYLPSALDGCDPETALAAGCALAARAVTRTGARPD